MTEDIDPTKHSSEDAAFRSALRRERLLAREALPGGEHARLSALVLDHLFTLLAPREPSTLAFYWPIRAEIDCRPLAARLIGLGWTVFLPAVLRRHAVMRFRPWTPASTMIAGEYGIPTVADSGQDASGAGVMVTPEVLLLPLNAFDRRGFRLGYGGGYYDRTLAAMAHRPLVIGIGFELGRVDSIRPHAQDFAMNAVVTERGVELFEGSRDVF